MSSNRNDVDSAYQGSFKEKDARNSNDTSVIKIEDGIATPSA